MKKKLNSPFLEGWINEEKFNNSKVGIFGVKINKEVQQKKINATKVSLRKICFQSLE